MFYVMCVSIFLFAVLVSFVSTVYVRDFARSEGWLDQPQLDRHVHTTPIPRIGGVAILGSFLLALLAVLLFHSWLQSVLALRAVLIFKFLAPALIVFFLGLYDDLRGLNPYWKFGIQAGAAALLFFEGYGIHRLDLFSSVQPLQTVIGLPLTIFWVLLITNAFNLIDGLDGLSAGSALFSTAVVFILASLSGNAMLSALAAALSGSILGFLCFNFHPASIFMGDSGSLFIGFMISALAIAGSQKAPTMIAVAIPVVYLAFPILDVALAVSRRFLRGSPLFKGDRDHIHHKLLKQGFSQREAVILLYLVTAAFGLLSLTILHHATFVAVLLGLTGTAVLIGIRQLRYSEFDEMLSIMQRSMHRRQFVTNHVAVRRATESLGECHDFSSICHTLQCTLQPMGFDGVRLQMLHPNGFAAPSFWPMNYEPDGKLTFAWSGSDIGQSPWELRLELLSSSKQCWGYFTLVRLSNKSAIALDLNVLTMDFRSALARAVERACACLEAHNEDSAETPAPIVRRVSASSP